MACRSVPVLLKISALLERWSSDAWIVNYTNPTNNVTHAVLRFGRGGSSSGSATSTWRTWRSGGASST